MATAADVLEILPAVSIPVATVGHLVLGPEDRSTARTAVELIVERGFARGRALSTLLDEYLDNAGTA